MHDEIAMVGDVLRARITPALDPIFISITLDLLDHLGRAIGEMRCRGVLGWSQPALLDVIRLEWIWLLATRQAVLVPSASSGPVEMADFRDDVIGSLRWYLRNLREEGIDLSQPLTAQPDLADLELRHSLFTLPIAQAIMRINRKGAAMLDRLRTRRAETEPSSVH